MDAPIVEVVPVPEIRDYQRIRSEVVRALDAGRRRIRLAGVERQRLLLAGLAGPWEAVIEIDGHAGPELAADLDAPGVVVVCRGGAGDGAGRGLRRGHLLILGDVADAVAYRLAGGIVVVNGSAGHRAGLELADGTLILAGATGRLLGDRQRGGRIITLGGPTGPQRGYARHGGRLIRPGAEEEAGFDLAIADDRRAVRKALRPLVPWLPPSLAEASWPGELADHA